MPGVSYERQLQFTPQGPVVVHILRAPRPGGLYALRPLLSNDALLGRETVTSMQKRARASANVAGVNGDLFTWDEGLPSGMLMQSGVLEAPPHPRRSTLGITDDGSLLIDRVTMLGQWQGAGPLRALNGLNQRPGAQGISLFTPVWGAATPQASGTVEVVLEPLPPAAPFIDLTGTVIDIKTGGGTPIPRDGAVLVARGSAANRLAAESEIGGPMLVKLVLRPQWGAVVDAIGGGPLIVRDGQPVFAALEDFAPSQINPRNPRTAVGQLADGRIVMVAVDGRQSGYSVGLTTFELAQQLVRLGAVTGTALDSGGSTTMAFNGKLLNRPSDPGGERAVSDSLNVFYYGVVVPQAPKPVLSPNGDGVAETQTLTYKLVRPATVTASLIGPDGIPRQTETGLREAGHVPNAWSGRTPGGGFGARRPLALGRERARRPGAAFEGRAAFLPEQDARLPARPADARRRPPARRQAPGRFPPRASGSRNRHHPKRARRAGQDDSAPPRLGSAHDPLERALRERRPRVHGRRTCERAGGELVRADRARAALPGAESPALAS